MRIVLLALLLAHSLAAAVVQGVVLDSESGLPLARTLIHLIPIEGTRAQPLRLRVGERGTFAIMSVAPGWYVMRSSRKAYVTSELGQARVGRPGRPFHVERDDQSFFFDIRMSRTAAVSGVVVDDNNVGIPDWDVHVYTSKQPVVKIAQGKTDDRGNFRIWGLDAGTYIVRSGAGALEDDSTLLPTYHRGGTALIDADPVVVKYGQTTTDLRIQAVKGKLLTISGAMLGPCTRVMMVTDTSRHTVDVGKFIVEHVPPGLVDIIAEGGNSGGILHLNADRDLQGQIVPCVPIWPLRANFTLGPNTRNDGQLFLRRIDLDGTGEPQLVRTGDRITPGKYEAMAASSDGSNYAYSMTSDFKLVRPAPDGSFQIEVSTQPYLTINLRPAGTIQGSVLSDGKPVVGAPVFVEMFDPTLAGDRQRLRLLSLRTDVNGKYLVQGLVPAPYRVLSSFDFDPEDRYAMEKGFAVTLKGGDSVTQDLKMLP